MTTLTTEQIQALHTFVRKHYVEYYDIEVELVDHLANGIESQWAEDNTVDFEIALDREFKKFGIFGFSDVVDRKEGSLKNYYIKLILKEIVHFLHWPKVIMTAGLYYSLYLMIAYLSQSFELRDITSITGILAVNISGIYLVIASVQTKRESKTENKRWLMDRVRLSILAFPITAYWLFITILSGISRYSVHLCVLSVLFIGLWLYITHFVISPQLKREKEKIKNKILMV